MRTTKLLILLLCCLILPQAAQAATYYLDAINGNDVNPGTEAQPWKTITRAYDNCALIPNVEPGDTIYLKNGNYGAFNEVLSAPRNSWVTYKAAEGHTPVFTKISVTKTYTPSVNAYIKFDGINIQQPAYNPPDDGYWHYDDTLAPGYLLYVENINYAQFLNGTYTGYNKYLSKGVYIKNSADITIQHCEIGQMAGTMIDIVGYPGPCDNVTIRDCYIHHTSTGSGLRIQGTSVNTLFENNHIYSPALDENEPYFPHIEASRYYYYLEKTGDFIIGENVRQDAIGATGVITAQSDGLLRIFRTSLKTLFQINQSVKGETSGAVATITKIGDNPSYHPGSGFSIRSSNVVIRKNILHGGSFAQGLKFYDESGLSYNNMIIENNLFYDCGPVLIAKLNGPVVVRNNTGIGSISDIRITRNDYIQSYRYSGYPLAISLNAGYNGSDVSIYNNICVGYYNMPDPTDPSLLFDEDYNINWTKYSYANDNITKGTHSKIAVWRDGWTLHGWYDTFEDIGYSANTAEYTHQATPQPFFIAPDYRTNNGYGYYPTANGVFCDYHLAEGSLAINFGAPVVATYADVMNKVITGASQPPDSLGTLGADGFIRDDGPARDQLHHSAGCYEYGPASEVTYGDVSNDGEISAYDAALTAQAAVGLITLTADQAKAADVSGDGKVSAYDAALIAQRAVGLISKFPVEG